MNARQRGISLIEVLVTLIILLVGLLGLAGLVAHSNQSEMESYQRVQALQLMNDMVSRLNANRQVASCYSNSTTGVTLGTGATSIPTCGTGSSAQQTQATNDLTEWDTLLKGSAELSGTSRIGAMIGARGLGGEVWKAIQRLQIGNGFEAGLGIVIVAITLDRLFRALAQKCAGQN